MDPIKYNKQLDAELLAYGVVSRELYFELADAYSYDAASTTGWVGAKLRILAKRLSAGEPVFLYSPNEPELIQCVSVAALQSWAGSLFPSVDVTSS